MKKTTMKYHVPRNRLKWYMNGAIVITVSICILTYLVIFHLYGAIHSELYQGEALLWAFAGNILKCAVIVLAAALFWYFISTQEYHAAFSDLMDIFAITDAEDSEAESSNPYSKNKELDKLLLSANDVMSTNKIYKSQLDKQKELMLENYIMRLMKGRVKDISAAYESGEAFGVDLHANSLQVVVFGMDEDNDYALPERTEEILYEMLRTLIKSTLFVSFGGYLTEVDGMIACLLVPLPGKNLSSKDCTDELKRITTLIQYTISEKADCSLRISIGSVCVGISGIEKSFSEAVELFHYAEITQESSCVLVYREVPEFYTVDTDDYFWFKKEMQFMNCINAEDYKSAATLFAEILDSEYIRSGLPLKLANCRMMGLVNSMVNALGKVSLTMDADFFERLDPWNTILSCKSLHELKKHSLEIFNSINHYMENQKCQSPYDRMNQIISYLKENYSDPNLSVASIADYFRFNPSYFSRIFKKHMGIGIAEYLQHVRIEESLKLMKNKELSVREVSTMVGYSSVFTMNRAFKKYEGTTAGRLRNADQKAEI